MIRLIKYCLPFLFGFHLIAQENVIIRDLIVTHTCYGKMTNTSMHEVSTQTNMVQNESTSGFLIHLNFFADSLKAGDKLIIKIGTSENPGLLKNEELIIDAQMINEKNILILKTNDDLQTRRSVLVSGFVALGYFIKLSDRDNAKIMNVRIFDRNDLELTSAVTAIKL